MSRIQRPTSDNRQVKESTGQTTWFDDLLQAIRQNDCSSAEKMLAAMPGDLPVSQRERLIDQAMEKRQWPIAIALMTPFQEKSVGMTLRWNLARNMAELQQFRPEVYQRMEPVRSSGRFRICTSPAGRLTISHPPSLPSALPSSSPAGASKKDAAAGIILSPGGDPQIGLQQIIPAVKPHIDKGSCLGLLSIGDGYALERLAGYHPELFLDQTLPIHLIEPHAELVLNCLMLHDYTGEKGPIRQKRIQWHIGDDAIEQYAAALQNDPYLPPIQVSATIGLNPQELGAAVKQVHDRFDEQTRQARQRINALYAKPDYLKLASVICVQAVRPPKALVMTSRFTSVLQYQAKDWCQSLEQLGWQTHLEMESGLHGRVCVRSILQSLETHQPDVVFALDHLRREDLDAFPTFLPFVTWVQDLLPHLLEKSAGQSVGPTDFVMTFAQPLLVGDFDYPASQCLDVPMMTPPLPPPPKSDPSQHPPPKLQFPGCDFSSTEPDFSAISASPNALACSKTGCHTATEGSCVIPESCVPVVPKRSKFKPVDLVYVSHMGWTYSQVLQKAIQRSPVEIEWAVRRCASAMAEEYRSGRSLASMYDVRRFMNHVLTTDAQGRKMNDDHQRKLLDALWNPVNITLYRQQALDWVVNLVREMNLTLEIYGKGWPTHPAYSHWAKGELKPGADWAQRVGSAKINLCLEPYIASTHNRLLAGLTCGHDRGGTGGAGEVGGGGFFLIRDHPAHQNIPQLWRFLKEHVSDSVRTAPQARRAITPTKLAELESLLTQSANISYSRDGDAVAQLRCFERAEVIDVHGTLLPKLDEVSFSDQATLKSKLDDYLNDADARSNIVRIQRQAVVERLSLVSVMRRVMPLIAKRLAEQAK